MDFSRNTTMCSFCAQPGSDDRHLVGGLGAMICVPCIEDFHDQVSSPVVRQAASRPPWERMSDADLLVTLPNILRSAEQVENFATDWVGLIRERGVSWAAVGQALGVSRQAVWERFAKRTDRRGAAG